MGYILISLISILISYLLFLKITDMRLNRLNMLSYVFYMIIIFQLSIGSLIISLKKDNHYIISKIATDEIRYKGYLYINIFIILFPLLLLLFSKLMRFNIKNLNNKYSLNNLKTSISKNDTSVYIMILIFLFISIVSTIYVFYYLKGIPLLKALLYGENSSRLRIEASREFKGNEYIKNLIFLLIPPIFTFVTYSYWRLKKRKKWKRIFYIFFLLTFLCKTYDLSKAPFLLFLLNFYLLKVVLENEVKKRQIIKLILIISLILLAIYTKQGQGSVIFTYNQGPIGRIILTQLAGVYSSIAIFPQKMNFLYGSTEKTSSRILMEVLNPSAVKEGIAGVVNTLFIGEAYAHYGEKGIIFSIIYVALIFSIFFKIMSLSKKTPITISIYVYLGFSYFINNLTGGIIAYVYSPYIYILIIYIFLLYFGSYFFKGVINWKRK